MDFRDITEFFKDAFKYIVLIVVVILIFIYVVSIQQVNGPSMNPTLNENDVLFVNRFVYRFGDVNRGDIVSFNYKDMKNLVKRVIGLPGEHIEYKDNQLYVNGVTYKEDYLKDVKTDDFDISEINIDTIPNDYYFVLGDNRENSMDSREIGLISKKDIIGKIGLRIFPFNNIKLVR